MSKRPMTAALRVRMTAEQLAALRRVADEQASSMGRIARLALADYIVRLGKNSVRGTSTEALHEVQR